MAHDPPHEISWQAPEFEHRPKTVQWYWVTIALAILLLGIALWQRNWAFAAFVVIAELMLMVFGSSEPAMISFSLGRRGLTIGGTTFYPFSDIRSWSADSQGFFDPEWPDITIHFKGHFHTGIRIKVPQAIFLDVERILRAEAREIPFKPSMIDVLEKLLGF